MWCLCSFIFIVNLTPCRDLAKSTLEVKGVVISVFMNYATLEEVQAPHKPHQSKNRLLLGYTG